MRFTTQWLAVIRRKWLGGGGGGAGRGRGEVVEEDWRSLVVVPRRRDVNLGLGVGEWGKGGLFGYSYGLGPVSWRPPTVK